MAYGRMSDMESHYYQRPGLSEILSHPGSRILCFSFYFKFLERSHFENYIVFHRLHFFTGNYKTDKGNHVGKTRWISHYNFNSGMYCGSVSYHEPYQQKDKVIVS